MTGTTGTPALVAQFRRLAAQHRATAEVPSAALYRDTYLETATILDGLADDLEALVR